MSIESYSDLKASISAWSKRSDVADYIADFVAFAEVRLYDLLLLKDMETESELTTSVGSATVSIPDGYVSPIAAWIEVDGSRTLLRPALPQDFDYSDTESRPEFYAIDGSNIRFDCLADDQYSVFFRFYQRSNLSDSNTSNALLVKRPDLYLAACMVECARFCEDVEMFNAWESKVQDSLKAVKAAENRARAAVELRTDLPIRVRSNIFTG